MEFQSTCPARGTTRSFAWLYRPRHQFQSTCPARGTTENDFIVVIGVLISIHVPREGHDQSSTGNSLCCWDFNPRAPRGARHAVHWVAADVVAISIHVPREGHDTQA